MTLSRRQFLAAVLGAPLAAAACRRRPAPRGFGGRLLGQSDKVGHRLLQAAPAAGARSRRAEVVIVGGGIAGLSAAWRLLRAGVEDFVVLEAEPQLGGTSASGPSYPWAAHYIPTPPPQNRSLVTLLDELGVIEGRKPDGTIIWSEDALCHAPQERIFFKGTWYDGLYLFPGASAEDLEQLEAFDAAMRVWAGRRDARGRRAFALPIATASDDPEFTALDRISMAQYLDQNGWTSPRLRWWVDYGCRDDYGLRLEQTSAWAGILYFAGRLDGPGDPPSEFLTWPEGNGHLVRHLERALGERVWKNRLVEDIAPAGERVEVRAFDAERGEVESWSAGRVICATPRFVARRAVAPLRASPGPAAEFQYTPWVIANITLRDRPDSHGFPTAWDNVLYESRSLGYVVSTHQRSVDRGPTVWTWYLPLCSDDPKATRRELLDAPWEHWADAVVADLGRAHHRLEPLIENIDVWRWGHAMVRPRVGFMWSPARQQAQAPIGRIYFAHCDLSGVALIEEAHYHGVRAAEAILAELGASSPSLLR